MPLRERGPILLVEDHVDSREAFTAVLEMHGYRVIAAGDGIEALAYLDSGERPCAVLLDLVMPRLDGWTFLEALRALPGGADIPVIVLSGANKAPAETAAELGLPREHCFLKPCDPSDVVRVLGSHCHADGTRRAS